MILVTGAPATGKTTLSKNLAEKLGLPIINKDEIKELLFDTLGIKDKEWALKLGASSFELTFFFIEKLLQTGKSFVVEANFNNVNSKEPLLSLSSKYNYDILQLYCHTEFEVLYNRYKERDASGNRHPGHSPLTISFEDYMKIMNNKTFKLYFDKSIDIDVDTTDFNIVDFHQIYDAVGENLNS